MQRRVWTRRRYRPPPLDTNLRRAQSILYALSEAVYHGCEARVSQRAGSDRAQGQRFIWMGRRLKGRVA